MLNTSPKKIGNEVVLPIPNGIELKYDNYYAYSGQDGAIIFIPNDSYPSKNSKFTETH